MSKLQRIVDGQTLLFTTLPRIFQSLTVDLPSGSIRLSNGEHAYWRLNRNLADLKKSNVTLRECAARLAQAYKAMTESESFMNHYGLVRPPEISNESNMTKLFVGLLQMNGNRIEQSSVYYGGNKPVVDTITIPLGHQVQFNATRGMVRPPPGSGLKGRLWMRSEDAAKDVNHFTFNIYSPVVNLAERLHQDRLSKEITNKLRQTLPGQVNNPVVEFDEGQFDQYVGNGLKALVEKTAHPTNGQGKKKSALVEAPAKAESKVGRGLTEPAEYNPEFQSTTKAPGGGIIGNSLKTVIGDSSLGREFSEGSVQVPARGMTTASFRIDDPAFISVDGDVSSAEMAAQVSEAIADAAPAPDVTTDAEGTEYVGVNEVVTAADAIAVASGQTTEEVLVDLLSVDSDALQDDRDTQLVMHKVRSEVGNGTATKSVIVPTVLSPAQKALVRDAFMQEGIGEVWFYDIIAGSTAIVLQWDMTESEPRVDIQGQLIVADKYEGAGDHSFALPA